MIENEKGETLTYEDTSQYPQAASQSDVTEKETAAVVRKLDWHILPLCFILYTFSVLDRSNLGNAKLAGLQKDLKLTGNKYPLLATAFYVAYIVFQFTILGWKVFKPHKWVTFVVLFWGTVSTLQAACTSWGGLMACRFMLGVAETMFGPGIAVYFSFFYPRQYMGVRFGLFLSGSALANAYGGALAYALSHIHSGISNWRILFILEGAPTVILAIVAWFFIPDSPGTAKFLNEREKHVATYLVASHQAVSAQQEGEPGKRGINAGHLLDAFKDPKNWLFGLTYFSVNVSFASLPLFLPTIINSFGKFDSLTSNGLSAPPYVLSFILIIIVSIFSDRYRKRGPFAAFFAFVAAIGYLVLALTDSITARYVSCFLIVTSFVTVAVTVTWSANTNDNETKRAGGLWILNTVGQCGTLLGANSFPANEAPYYRKGMWIGFAFSMLAATTCTTISILLWRENRRRDALYGKVSINSSVDNKVKEDASLPAEATARFII